MLDEEANIFKVPYLYGEHGRICGGHKCEGDSVLPGEISQLVPISGTMVTERWQDRLREVSRRHSIPMDRKKARTWFIRQEP